MAKWLNRSLILAPRNGTNTHTVTFAPASAGNLLLAVVEGPVTSTTPAGWTLQTSAINNTGLYAWTKTATAAESSFTTTHNGANYPVGFVVYEFAAGSAWAGGIGGASLAPAAASPDLTGLTGTNLLFGAAGMDNATGTAMTGTWSGTGSPVMDVDATVVPSGTDGYWLGVAYVEDSTATSFQPTVAIANPSVTTKEALTFAVNVYTAPPPPSNARDLWLTAAPLPERWAAHPLLNRWATTPVPPRWATAPLENRMATTILASAGEKQYVGGAITEVTGKDISADTFQIALGDIAIPPSVWATPDVSVAGATTAQRIVKLLVSSTTAPGIYWCWVKISDNPEVKPLIVQGPITIA